MSQSVPDGLSLLAETRIVAIVVASGGFNSLRSSQPATLLIRVADTISCWHANISAQRGEHWDDGETERVFSVSSPLRHSKFGARANKQPYLLTSRLIGILRSLALEKLLSLICGSCFTLQHEEGRYVMRII